jgi:peptidoglycan/xylan/chitin deacetylase (PgdA/CDA1 family)
VGCDLSALILTYHAVEDGPGPLFVSPSLFGTHLDEILASGASILTVRELAGALDEGRLPGRVVAICFDDGFASVARVAFPLLRERGLTATVFCVAGYLGGANDWPTQVAGVARRPLASPDELGELVRAGFEIGAHGFDHAPLTSADEVLVHREVVTAQSSLEQAVPGARVTTIALPYGVPGSATVDALIRESYEAACTTRLSPVSPDDDPYTLPRVDAHYVKHPWVLRRALAGSLTTYLRSRELGARARRRFVPDHSYEA